MATTPNLGLHQWQPGDSFLRTDFNTDLGKIDAKLGELAQKLEGAVREEVLFDQENQTAVARIDLSLAEVDLSRFRELVIYVDNMPVSGGDMILRLNGISEAVYDHNVPGVTSNRQSHMAEWRRNDASNLAANPGGAVIRLMLVGGMLSCVCLQVHENDYSGICTTAATEEFYSISPHKLKAENLTTLNILTSNNTNVPAGMHLRVVGVRK